MRCQFAPNIRRVSRPESTEGVASCRHRERATVHDVGFRRRVQGRGRSSSSSHGTTKEKRSRERWIATTPDPSVPSPPARSANPLSPAEPLATVAPDPGFPGGPFDRALAWGIKRVSLVGTTGAGVRPWTDRSRDCPRNRHDAGALPNILKGTVSGPPGALLPTKISSRTQVYKTKLRRIRGRKASEGSKAPRESTLQAETSGPPGGHGPETVP